MSPDGAALARTCAGLYRQGWMPGTAGNLSVRTAAGALITASGLSKGELTEQDAIEVDLAHSQPIVPGPRRPSAETTIHTAVYRTVDAAAVVHAHPPYATAVASRLQPGGHLRLEHYELIKGLGLADPRAVEIPLFTNWPDVARIGVDIEDHLRTHSQSPPALLITGHGVTTWGGTLAQARDRMECVEALCQLAVLNGRAAPAPSAVAAFAP